jgi:hypothetical protein
MLKNFSGAPTRPKGRSKAFEKLLRARRNGLKHLRDVFRRRFRVGFSKATYYALKHFRRRYKITHPNLRRYPNFFVEADDNDNFPDPESDSDDEIEFFVFVCFCMFFVLRLFSK